MGDENQTPAPTPAPGTLSAFTAAVQNGAYTVGGQAKTLTDEAKILLSDYADSIKNSKTVQTFDEYIATLNKGTNKVGADVAQTARDFMTNTDTGKTLAGWGGKTWDAAKDMAVDAGNFIDNNKGGLMGAVGGLIAGLMMGADPLIMIILALIGALLGSALGDGGNGILGGLLGGGKKEPSVERGKTREITSPGAAVAQQQAQDVGFLDETIKVTKPGVGGAAATEEATKWKPGKNVDNVDVYILEGSGKSEDVFAKIKARELNTKYGLNEANGFSVVHEKTASGADVYSVGITKRQMHEKGGAIETIIKGENQKIDTKNKAVIAKAEEVFKLPAGVAESDEMKQAHAAFEKIKGEMAAGNVAGAKTIIAGLKDSFATNDKVETYTVDDKSRTNQLTTKEQEALDAINKGAGELIDHDRSKILPLLPTPKVVDGKETGNSR